MLIKKTKELTFHAFTCRAHPLKIPSELKRTQNTHVSVSMIGITLQPGLCFL